MLLHFLLCLSLSVQGGKVLPPSAHPSLLTFGVNQRQEPSGEDSSSRYSSAFPFIQLGSGTVENPTPGLADSAGDSSAFDSLDPFTLFLSFKNTPIKNEQHPPPSLPESSSQNVEEEAQLFLPLIPLEEKRGHLLYPPSSPSEVRREQEISVAHEEPSAQRRSSLRSEGKKRRQGRVHVSFSDSPVEEVNCDSPGPFTSSSSSSSAPSFLPFRGSSDSGSIFSEGRDMGGVQPIVRPGRAAYASSRRTWRGGSVVDTGKQRHLLRNEPMLAQDGRHLLGVWSPTLKAEEGRFVEGGAFYEKLKSMAIEGHRIFTEDWKAEDNIDPPSTPPFSTLISPAAPLTGDVFSDPLTAFLYTPIVRWVGVLLDRDGFEDGDCSFTSLLPYSYWVSNESRGLALSAWGEGGRERDRRRASFLLNVFVYLARKPRGLERYGEVRPEGFYTSFVSMSQTVQRRLSVVWPEDWEDLDSVKGLALWLNSGDTEGALKEKAEDGEKEEEEEVERLGKGKLYRFLASLPLSRKVFCLAWAFAHKMPRIQVFYQELQKTTWNRSTPHAWPSRFAFSSIHALFDDSSLVTSDLPSTPISSRSKEEVAHLSRLHSSAPFFHPLLSQLETASLISAYLVGWAVEEFVSELGSFAHPKEVDLILEAAREAGVKEVAAFTLKNIEWEKLEQ